MASLVVAFEDNQMAVTVAAPKVTYRLSDPSNFKRKARDHQHPKSVRQYYKEQTTLLQAYKDDRELLATSAKVSAKSSEENVRCDKETILSYATFACNVALLVAKIIASYLSGSLSILSSMVDSLVDSTSNIVIYVTNRAIRNRDLYHYPRGRTRLEPLALVIISIIMGIASLQVIFRSVNAMISETVDPKILIWINATELGNGSAKVNGWWDVDWRVMGVMLMTIALKLALCITCYLVARSSPTMMVLAQDHRNDCLSNAVAIGCGVLGQIFWANIDAIGALLISLYIAISWFITGYKQIIILSGHSAPGDFISRIIKICVDHHREIRHVDAVTVYHFGTQFIVEVDIVMNENMSLRQTHDISEPLQRKIEYFSDVERCFVHVEYQTRHTPAIEHKTV